jgi:hypothetical protein
MLKSNYKFVAIQEESVDDKGVIVGDQTIKFGKIVSAGNKVEDLKVGDKVCFSITHCLQPVIKGQKYYFLNYEMILCRL